MGVIHLLPMKLLSAFAILLAVATASAQRINHAGRILAAVPTVTQPLMFNTPEADAVLASLQIYPRTSGYNEDVSRLPVLSNSSAIIATITNDLRSDRRTLAAFSEMNYILVPDNQPLQPINFVYYPDQSDPSPYPIPSNTPVEPWPTGYGVNGASLSYWQMHGAETTDAHAIIVQPNAGYVWETWLMQKNSDGSWQAANGAKFNLNSNTLRPAGWTSGDAAGLSMLGCLVRYDECQRGTIEHALRLVVKHSRAQYLYPASHYASTPYTTDPNVPAMGQRLRLKSSFTVPAGWTKEEKAVCAALKKYGGLIADNGNFFSFSYAPDTRFAAGCFDNLSTIPVGSFEVVQSTGPGGGPRSANPPVANAGSDFTATPATATALHGSVSGGVGTVVNSWYLYSGPGTVTFSNSASPTSSATFSTKGVYTLMLKSDDGVHTPAYDAVVVTVQTAATVGVGSVDLSKITVVGGNIVGAVVRLTSPAPAGGQHVDLASSNPAVAHVSTYTTVPAGGTGKGISVITYGVAAVTSVNVSASANGTTATSALTVKPAALVSVAFVSSTVTGGTSATATMKFSGKSPASGWTAALKSNNPAAIVVSSVSISNSVDHYSFAVKTHGVTTQTTATITATINGVSRSAVLTIQPT